MREIRWLPQEMLDSAADFAGPILDMLLVVVPIVLPFMIVAGIARAALQFRLVHMEQFKLTRDQNGPYFTLEQEKKLRSVPLSFGLWGLIAVHIFMWMIPGTVRWMNSNAGSGMILDVITMFFAFLTLFGVFNLLLRFALDGGIRKKFKIQDFGILHHLMGALGVGIYCWAAIRPASVWTGTIGNQLFSDAWNGKLFDESYTSPAMLMPTMAKLHFVLGMTAFGALLHSKLITHLLVPNLKTWGLGKLLDGSGDDRTDAASVAAGLAGVTIEKK